MKGPPGQPRPQRLLGPAIQVFNGMTSRRVDLRQNRAAVLGEELARRGVGEVVSELTRSPEARETMLISLAMGRAETVLRVIKPVSEINPARMAEGVGMQAKYLHPAPPVHDPHECQWHRSDPARAGGQHQSAGRWTGGAA